MKLFNNKNLYRLISFFSVLIALLVLCVSQFAIADSANESSVINDQIRKGPYLIYPGKNNQMKALWQLNETAGCVISWGIDTSYSSGSAKTKEYGKDHQHSYVIKKLKPGEKYFYKVVFGNEEHLGSFLSAPKKNANKIKFFVYGDTRSFPHIHNEISSSIISAYTQDPLMQTFSLFVGDFVTFGAEESSWDNELFGAANTNIRKMMASLPVLACAGNHELSLKGYKGVDKKFTLFKKYFPYPFIKDTYWSFDYGPAHFMIVDQYSNNLKTKELEWIKKDLKNTDKPWKFICLHEPGWSAGSDEAHKNNETVQKLIQPIAEKYQVTAVFAGNNHFYSRALVNGVYHITTGGGGAPLHDPEPYLPKVIITSKSYHYCKVAIDDNTLTFKAVKPDGTVIDTFMLKASLK